jgi:hypothetical protein
MLLDPEDMSLRGTILGWEARHEAGLSNECEGRYAGSLWCIPSLSHFWQHYGGRVDSCTLHRHGLATLSVEPISKPQEIRHHRRECLDLLVHPLVADEEETGDDHLLVNINPATAVIHDLHRFLAFRISALVDEPCQVGYQEQRESSGCFSWKRATFGGA